MSDKKLYLNKIEFTDRERWMYNSKKNGRQMNAYLEIELDFWLGTVALAIMNDKMSGDGKMPEYGNENGFNLIWWIVNFLLATIFEYSLALWMRFRMNGPFQPHDKNEIKMKSLKFSVLFDGLWC